MSQFHLVNLPSLPAMVMTVEPGIYLPDFGGVRIEDLCLVTKSEYELLTDCPVRLVCG